MGLEYFGLRACYRSLSALHAEMEGLLWAASCMRDKRITLVQFDMDCSDIVDMTINPMEGPSFTTEIDVFQRLQKDFEDAESEWPGKHISSPTSPPLSPPLHAFQDDATIEPKTHVRRGLVEPISFSSHVTRIQLKQKGIRGTLPPDLQKLSELVDLEFFSSIRSTLPPDLLKLSELVGLKFFFSIGWEF
ncbi:hypothetical protein Bca4012_090650 [Brassica carinata]